LLKRAKGEPLAKQSPPLYLYFIIGCAALNSVNLGFDIGVNSGAFVLLQEDVGLLDWQIGVCMGMLHFVAALGGLMNHAISDRFGRRRTFMIAQVLFILGVVIFCTAHSFTVLIIGRVFLGLGIGIGLAIDALYIAELAPAAQRGALVTWSEIGTNLGILIGFAANLVLDSLPAGVDWRVMIACGAFLPVVLMVLSVTVMPESPRWLIAKGRESAAEDVLRRTHGPGQDISGLASDIKHHIDVDAEYEHLGWAPLLRPDAATRRMMMTGVGIAFAQQLNGIESVVLYSPHIFREAGVATTTQGLFRATIVIGVVKTLFIVVSACFLDNVGRRPMLILSTSAMSVCLLLLSLGLLTGHMWLAMISVCCFLAFFSLGIGPICWLLAAEVFPLRIRAKALSLATALNRFTSGLVAATFPPLSNAMGLGWYYLMFACITVLTAIFTYMVVPETKGRTLEQLMEDFRSDFADSEGKML